MLITGLVHINEVFLKTIYVSDQIALVKLADTLI
jgi:hypothetical protein